MSLLGKIFSGGAKDIMDSAGSIIDKVVTTDKKRGELKNQLTTIVTDKLIQLSAMQKDVLVAEMGGNWLQKSWRPLIMLSFGLIVFNIYFFLPLINIWVKNADITTFVDNFKNIDQFWSLLKIGIGGYVAGRSIEKITENVTKNIDISFLRKKDRKTA